MLAKLLQKIFGRPVHLSGVIVESGPISTPLATGKKGAQWVKKATPILFLVVLDCSTSPLTPKKNWIAVVLKKNIPFEARVKLGI